MFRYATITGAVAAVASATASGAAVTAVTVTTPFIVVVLFAVVVNLINLLISNHKFSIIPRVKINGEWFIVTISRLDDYRLINDDTALAVVECVDEMVKIVENRLSFKLCAQKYVERFVDQSFSRLIFGY